MNDAVVDRHGASIKVARQARSLGRILGVVVLVLASGAAMAWSARRPILTVAGRVLIAEDPVAPVDMIVVSMSDIRADAVEAASLYRRGMAGSVILPTIRNYRIDDEIRRLGVPYPTPTALAAAILEYGGVPKSAIDVVPDTVDGTDTEVAAVTAFVRERMPRSVLFLTARSHTARARWLLRRQLPVQVQLTVRSPRTDDFAADSWWHSREQSRDVVMEYLRWVNSFIFGDLWAQ